MNFTTERLRLRPVQIEDKESIFNYHSDSHANKYQGWIPKTIEDVETFIGNLASIPNQPGTWFQIVLIEKKASKIIGDIGIHFFDTENNHVELGITLAKEHHGKGYATEALFRIIDYVFNDLKKHRVTTSIDPDNFKSISLVKKLGFRKEAHFIESLYLNGKWVDDIIYALLSREWEPIKS